MTDTEVWLTVKEVAGLIGLTPRAIQIAVNKSRYIEEPGRGYTGKSYRIALSSLPADAQARYWAARKAQEEMAAAAERTGFDPAELVDLYGRKLIEEAHRREAIVKEALSFPQGSRDRTKRMTALATAHGINRATLYRWIEDYERDGFRGLIDQPRERPGYGAQLPLDARLFIKQQYLRDNQPSKMWVYEQYQNQCDSRGWDKGITYSTVARFLETIPPTELVMGREGTEAWRNKMMPKAVRARVKVANAYWVGDHHRFDFWINYEGRPVRPWLTTWRDMCSGAVMGWTVCLQPSSQSIAEALRYGILPKEDGSPFQGLPANVYIDNGKDYRSKHLDAVFSVLKIEATYCQGYTPWSKPIERDFRIVVDRFSRHAPGWCGNKPENRPEKADEKAKAMLKAGKLWTLQDVVREFGRHLATDYHARPHSRLKISRLEMWEKAPKARVEMPDPRALDICLMKVESAMVEQNGIKRLHHYFWHDDLAPLIRQSVSIRYDPARLGELVMFHRGRFVCVARSRELLEMGANSDAVKAWCKFQKEEKKRVKAAISGEVPQSLEEVATAQAKAGPRMVTPGNRRKAQKVTDLTGFERAGKVLAEGQASPERSDHRPTARRRDTARDLIDDLLFGYADKAMGGGR